MTTRSQADLLQQSDQLYARYVKPLEQEHTGEYVAVANDGRTVLAADLLTLADAALEQLGPGSFAFKIGEKAVGKWR
jgi:hypothetical protein